MEKLFGENLSPAQDINIGTEKDFVVIGTLFVVLRLTYLSLHLNKDCVRKHWQHLLEREDKMKTM